jgi:hypothetical protein
VQGLAWWVVKGSFTYAGGVGELNVVDSQGLVYICRKGTWYAGFSREMLHMQEGSGNLNAGFSRVLFHMQEGSGNSVWWVLKGSATHA